MQDVPSQTGSAVIVPELEAARRALADHDWPTAYNGFSAAERQHSLSGADLEDYALSAFFTARPQEELEIRERAVKAYQAEGSDVLAAATAIHVARSYGYEGKGSMASAWVRRAESLLGGEGETFAHGFLEVARSEAAVAAGDVDAALAHAERAIALSDRNQNADLKANARSNLGTLKIATGDTNHGLELMEEASISAVQGELTPFTTGVTCCQMISTCRDLTDYNRASEWIDATERYCARQELSGFPGVCRVHRAEVAAVRGAWEQAEEELVRATSELERYRATIPQADGYYAIGEVRRLKGDFEGAESALREAQSRGRSPQPALALIRLARGQTKAALSAIGAALDEAWDRPSRSRLLPAQAQIAIAAGDTDLATRAIDEFTELVAAHPAPALEATRDACRGSLLLATGRPAEAARVLRAAIRAWADVRAPYEGARTRVLLAAALRAIDDEVGAIDELRIALETFERLGAVLDAAEARRVLRASEDPVRVSRTFLFTDIVGSVAHAGRVGEAAWVKLLDLHDDVLRHQIATAGGDVVNTTGDGVFAAFESADAGIQAAVAIQRDLRTRRAANDLPFVRIGLHFAEATRRGNDYTGTGVNVAARVAAIADADEILASVAVLDERPSDAPALELADTREVALKGVVDLVRISRIGWG